MVVGPRSSCESPSVYLGPLILHVRPTVTNLGFKMDSDFKLDRQIGTVVKSSFFHLRQLAKVKPILLRQHSESVIPVSDGLLQCTLFWSEPVFPLTSPAGSKCSCTSFNRRFRVRFITPILASLHWLPVYFTVNFKLHLFF